MYILNTATSHASAITKELLARIHNDSRGYNLFHSARGRKVAFESLNNSFICIFPYLLDH
jgi:hypothetical protein